ncbi:hypothetical protein ONS95_000461 [Cadophora gregata]|uniref:uncharacterized protein n=1 Tax=Cadophora gregata TaxID=51156 RepID=UPI0026DC1037|nr:uncharacterized protein ONS95_000461 [Cadophora gregata]KAK0128489.1 hypothetical protein ONS95_000461 [Cadophora gregata]
MDNTGEGERDRAVNRTMDTARGHDRDELFMDVIEIQPAPPSPIQESRTHSKLHSTGLSESQNLLPSSPKKLSQYSATAKDLRLDRPIEKLKFEGAGGIKGGFRVRGGPAWSGVPQTLRKSRMEWWRSITVDVLAVGASFPFFALAGTLIWFNGEEAEAAKKNILEQCIKGAATLFPLCFSVVVGRAMVKFASWNLEKGASLGLLERLVGSRTVGGTIITQARLRSITLVSFVLVLLWLLSPLGSQSILRILSTSTKTSTLDAETSYSNSRQASRASTASSFSGFAAMFSSALVTPDQLKNSSMDIWGNVRIPLFASLSNIGPDENGWRQIPRNNYTPAYTSLFGIPIATLPVGNTTLNLESTYMQLDCSNITSQVVRGSSVFTDPGLISSSGPFNSSQIISANTTWAMGYVGEDVTSLLPNPSIQSLDSLPSDLASKTFLPGLFLYQDFTGRQNVTSVYCIPSQVYVESAIRCDKSSASKQADCAVAAQRLSLLPHMPTALTSFAMLSTFLNLTSLLPVSTPAANNIDIVQNYLINPFSNAYIQSTPSVSQASLSTNSTNANETESRLLSVTLENISHRLSQIINTFIQGTLPNAPSYLKHDISVGPASIAANTSTLLSAQISALAPTLTVPSKLLTLTSVLSISWVWTSLFLFSTLIMLLAALFSEFFSRRTLTRDYLSGVSSLCRESQYVSFPAGGVGLDGLERSRLCQNLRIKLGDLGDVEGGCEVGTGVAVSVGSLGIGNEEMVIELDKRKLYL